MFVLGINTGTSVDGIDLALVKWDINNLKSFEIVCEKSYPFDDDLKLSINKIINKQQGYLEEISDTNFKFSLYLGKLVQEFRNEKEVEQIDLIGFHGQTIFHSGSSTWQIGDASIISNVTGITTISGFRSADMAVGGCGAPLMSFFDDKIIRNDKENVATLNIGGIANITYLGEGEETAAYDTGPGNTLVDTLMMMLYDRPFDDNGAMASKGKINERFVENLTKQTEYFSLPAPKATGRELFNDKFASKFLDLGNKESIIDTASHFTVYTITRELKKFPIEKIYVSGGGSKNHFIIESLKKHNPGIQFLSHEEFGINSQFKEAMLFSLLAFTCINKVPNNIPSSTGAKKATILGKVAYV